MTKPLVLCLNRNELLAKFQIPLEANGLFDLDLNAIDPEQYQFLNRHIVDNKHVEAYQAIGYQFPQVLPYVLVTDGNGKYLSYSRNGTETRLHGSRSIGVGGHVDISDLAFDFKETPDNEDIINLIDVSVLREMSEEIGWTYDRFLNLSFDWAIVDTTNSVGKVHLGVFGVLTYPDAQPQEELYEPKWLTADELKADIDNYENWSKIIIDNLDLLNNLGAVN